MRHFDRSMFVFSRRAVLAGAGSLAMASGSAQATWSILIADTRTGEIVIGSATCVELIDLQQSTPVLISGVGAVTAQSAVDTSGRNRQLIRDRLLQGLPLGALLDELAMTDGGHNNRQYGMITAMGETLTYSGIQNAAWAGGQTGRIERGQLGPADDIVYSVQGNILSGGNVVQAAVDAIIASSGDLPAMMMEGMQAAKAAGGDGRCSCSPADPTGCGSPPPTPFKSADVGYMLGTRAGDTDAVRANYPTDDLIGDITTLDLDNDGFEEVIVASASSNELLIYTNTSMLGDPLSTLHLEQTLSTPSSSAVAMGSGDFDNDGIAELALVQSDPPRLTIYQTDATGGLIDPVSLDLPGTPTDMAIGSLTAAGDTIALTMPATQQVLFYGSDIGAYTFLSSLNLTYTPQTAGIAQWISTDDADLVVADNASNSVYVYERTGPLSFAAPSVISTLTEPVGVRSADMDLDGDNEILVQTASGRRVQIFSLDQGVWSEWASVITAGVGLAAEAGDMSGDGFPDLVTTVAATNRNMQLFISDGQGGFTQQTRTRVGPNARSIELRDMNNNGDLDIVVGNGGNDGLILLDNPRDHILPQPGRFAEGDYFLSLNIPNQRRDDPDPVDQLQVLYDQWVLDRSGRIDAVRSRVLGRQRIATDGSVSITIELRDLNGELLPITDPAQVQSNIDGIASAQEAVLVEPGVFEITLDAGSEIGSTALTVLAGDPSDPVQLMPSFEVFVAEQSADLDADGRCTFLDVSQFIRAYVNNEPDADFNGDEMFNFVDVSAYIGAFNACTN